MDLHLIIEFIWFLIFVKFIQTPVQMFEINYQLQLHNNTSTISIDS